MPPCGDIAFAVCAGVLLQGLTDLEEEEPYLLFERTDQVFQHAYGGASSSTSSWTPRRGHSGFDGVHDVSDAVANEDFSFGRGMGGGSKSDRGWWAVEIGVDGVYTLGNLVGFCGGDANDLVQVEVDIAEVLADHVPVDLLAHAFEDDGVHQSVLAAHRSWWWMQ